MIKFNFNYMKENIVFKDPPKDQSKEYNTKLTEEIKKDFKKLNIPIDETKRCI